MIYGLDPLYWILMLPVLVFSLIAQSSVKSSFRRYSKVAASGGLTGRDAAERILRAGGVTDVRIEPVRGWLSDHYSPGDRVLRLSEGVYNSRSISAVGVAAHEAGHALQHSEGWAVMRLWQTLAKPAAFASNFSVWFILIGMLLGMMSLAKFGFILFLAVVIFQIITLPVEFNASTRAKKLLFQYHIVGTPEEAAGVSRVLNSAAMTYVANAAASISQLLYFALRLGIGRDD